MLIKAITLFRLRAVSDFLFNFVLWLTLMKYQSVTKTKYWHTISSQLFSFTLRYKLCFKWILSKPSVFTCFVCIRSFGRVWSSKCTLLVSFRARRTHTHKHTRTHTSAWGTASLVWIVLSTFIIKHVQQFSNCNDGILQQSTDDWSDSDVKFWSGRNECAPLWREGSCAYVLMVSSLFYHKQGFRVARAELLHVRAISLLNCE